MNLSVLAAGIARPEAAEALLALPEFRKATLNMALACAAIDAMATTLPEGNLAAILATSHGELDATIQFLKNLGASGVARPFLFQNSLHSSTLGFLTQRFALRGPAFTVSRGLFSGEDALELASDLIAGGAVTHALVCGVDSVPPGFESMLAATYASPTLLGKGAGALFVAGEAPSPAARRAGIAHVRDGSHDAAMPYYDSNVIERIAAAVLSGKPPRELLLPKPDGSAARVTFQ